MANGTACAKLILCGEHAVVYGRPAIALPLADLRAHVSYHAAGSGDLRLEMLDTAGAADVFTELAYATAALIGMSLHGTLTIRSEIPIASGMGSGAAIATALVRALAAHAGVALAAEVVSQLVYRSEQRLHGTPSGIDNTVVAYERPIWFQRAVVTGQAATLAPITNAVAFELVVGDTGVRSATRLPVEAVHAQRDRDPLHYEATFDAIADLVAQVRTSLATGNHTMLGAQLDTNHALLQAIGVSSAELDRLVEAARRSGALGAKLSGAGWGGVMLALAPPAAADAIAAALRSAGAVRTFVVQIATA
ncbi:MAG TPA: mevalonate kinase [Roseiflexaceae bacterium]|nr:mevalonate kinase [Roseiflexaceae bacterium]